MWTSSCSICCCFYTYSLSWGRDDSYVHTTGLVASAAAAHCSYTTHTPVGTQRREHSRKKVFSSSNLQITNSYARCKGEAVRFFLIAFGGYRVGRDNQNQRRVYFFRKTRKEKKKKKNQQLQSIHHHNSKVENREKENDEQQHTK